MKTGERIIDIHTHILPGIDDGSQSMDESIQMLRIAEREGITDVMVTPHYKGGRHNASPQTVLRLLDELREHAVALGISVSIHLGNEVLYFSEVEEALDEKYIFTMNGSDFVLVEFHPGDRYGYIRNALDHVQGMGYTPVLAHVERYACMLKDKDAVRQIRDMGVRIQVNASSVEGALGWSVKHFTHEILRKHLVDYIGTDAHNCDRRAPEIQKCAKILYKKFGDEYADSVLYGNAQRDFDI
ncbi:MAG: protein-tyrosine-phosphatase [Lachnoclostridium sp.]|nr:protein-tyrosine-phosphatase [Lachnospira sp.]MCM1249102.1 protein-tyrosine-phosphatase [Lachnoclostridium sp.]MCM1535249.1 protein-tyrosine-phosphatase [Clostridium sp.]